MADRPETSTVREALRVVAAVDQIARDGGTAEDAVAAIKEIILAARELRSHQVDDVIEHLHERYIGGDLAEDGLPHEPEFYVTAEEEAADA